MQSLRFEFLTLSGAGLIRMARSAPHPSRPSLFLTFMTMKKLEIDLTEFMMTFSADADYHAECDVVETHLNKRTGKLMTVPLNNSRAEFLFGDAAAADFKKNLRKLRAAPNNYLAIPSMSHGEHHDLLKEFLDTAWTVDVVAREAARNIYYGRKSIGCWLENVGDNAAIDGYLRYKESAPQRQAEQFLRGNGINFEWI